MLFNFFFLLFFCCCLYCKKCSCESNEYIFNVKYVLGFTLSQSVSHIYSFLLFSSFLGVPPYLLALVCDRFLIGYSPKFVPFIGFRVRPTVVSVS